MRCEDGDACTDDRCDAVLGCLTTPTSCDDRSLCTTDRCDRATGCLHGAIACDDGPNPIGTECTATDLCAPGWHICRSAADVDAHSPDGCRGAADAEDGAFFATRQTGPGCGHCATGTDLTCSSNDCRVGCAQTDRTSNDVFGCGTLGGVPQATSCGALDRFSNNLCSALRPPWRCDGDPAGLRESDFVVKPGPDAGGVLCCRD